MTSAIRTVEGGAFSKTSRFKTHIIETPGPNYELPSMMHDHVQAPRMHGYPKTATPSLRTEIPNPAKDRTAWMIGQTKDDLAYFADVADGNGPGHYKPDVAVVKPKAQRLRFTKDARFQPMTKQYVSKAHNQANLCTAGPGPRYLSQVTQMDLNRGVKPRWGFGKPTEFNTTRNSFLQGQIKDGYMYRALPATGEKKAVVSPATYAPKYLETSRTRRSVQQKFSRNDRFKTSKKQYQGKKMAHHSIGMDSPGPSYSPQNNTLARWAKKGQASSTPKGKWCP
jgi:hypothetical protein